MHSLARAYTALLDRHPDSLRTLAAKAGVSPATLSRISHGEFQPRPEVRAQLDRALALGSSTYPGESLEYVLAHLHADGTLGDLLVDSGGHPAIFDRADLADLTAALLGEVGVANLVAAPCFYRFTDDWYRAQTGRARPVYPDGLWRLDVGDNAPVSHATSDSSLLRLRTARPSKHPTRASETRRGVIVVPAASFRVADRVPPRGSWAARRSLWPASGAAPDMKLSDSHRRYVHVGRR